MGDASVRPQIARASKARSSASGPALLKVGDLLAGKYRVERILGEGGMGVVVAAHHELLDQRVAVKLLYQEVADREAQSRLLFEARACAKLQSAHVARMIDVDTGADGLPFIVMELLDGADLAQIADARGALPRWLVVDYMLQTLEGLAHAHAHGIVHRDLKPSNLFLTNRADGTQLIKILDFGISKSTDGPESVSGERRRAAQLTGGRAVLGSPPYMSPEQVRSPKTVDHRTDIWAIGIVMYELLTNSMPFGGGEVNETFAQILEKQPQPIRQIVNGVPEGLEAIVMRCLAKDRDARFADVGELARALAAYGSGSWVQSASRIQATLARVGEEGAAGPRSSGAPISMDRIPIPSSPGRRPDSNQSVLSGTARTVARRFSVLGPTNRNLLALAGVIGVAAIVLIVGTALHRSRAAAVSEPKGAAPSSGSVTIAEGFVEPIAPVAIAATGSLTIDPPIPDVEAAPASSVARVGVASAANPAAVDPNANAGGGSGASGNGVGGATIARKPPNPAPRGSAVAQPRASKPNVPASPPKPILPPGLPRERQ